MTDERKIITHSQYRLFPHSVVGDEIWKHLPDAPKHTDEEWEDLIESREKEGAMATEWMGKFFQAQARIKELEELLSVQGRACEFEIERSERYKEAKQ